ncbi:MAG: YciI family protein [Candidatus Limnocylindria bacterium]
MTQYLLSVHTAADGAPPSMSDEEMAQGMEPVAALEAEMRDANALVFSGRLAEASSATVVRKANGRVTMTDGPFVEAKEQIAGFYVVDAANLDQAVDWASRTSEAIGMPIEVRPFFAVAEG